MESSNRAHSQFHHFVPQFLLKNFAHPYAPLNDGLANQTNAAAGVKTYPGQAVVNCLDLSSEISTIMETPVRRMLGKENMYRDATKPYPEQHRVEAMLSQLESKASAVFRNVMKSFDEGHRGIWLTRNERNLVRKFIFLMKYRGPTFYQRYNYQTARDYDANDRDRLLEYMQKKGFERPVDVWLDNVKTIIELEMDDQLEWITELPKRMYPDDALWVVLHCQSMFMAICTPSDPQDDFIITDNCYHVFEGPSRVLIDPETGKSEELAWTSFHEFAPISPKLMIVLRSNLLSSEEEVSQPSEKAVRDKWWSLAVEHIFGSDTNSMLANLPISRARNNYTQLASGMLQLIPGEDGSLRREHKFFFRFSHIDTLHIDKIHGIFLDNASACTSIVFRSKERFRRTLEWYLTDPGQARNRLPRFPGDLRLSFLKKLAVVLKQMGSSKDPIWEEANIPAFNNGETWRLMREELRRLLPSMLRLLPDDNPTDTMKIYSVLCGSKQTLPKDIEQAGLMIKLRIKIDVWSYGIDESLRQRNRDLLMDAYLRLPSSRVWLYLKYWRSTLLRNPDNPIPATETIDQEDSHFEGPEDVIAKAQHIIDPAKLNNLMKIAVGNDIQFRKFRGHKLWDQRGGENFEMIQIIAFNGNIHECGIREIKKSSIRYQMEAKLALTIDQTLRDRVYSAWKLTGDQAIEMLTRMMVRKDFKPILDGKLDVSLLDDLEKSFFEIVYPTPPPKGKLLEKSACLCPASSIEVLGIEEGVS
ncbi:hypothetical protein BGZ63DRAFT_397949 [Mariannaea sp. PMI_226]|nr:hypothetical protein BGZ63DRAFT_397949 [Mariannaea sp. PMI_226]